MDGVQMEFADYLAELEKRHDTRQIGNRLPWRSKRQQATFHSVRILRQKARMKNDKRTTPRVVKTD